MTAPRFVDTNVLLYSLGGDERRKRLARALLDEPDLALSVQVLQEFYTQATRPGFAGRLPHEHVIEHIDALLRYPVQDMTVGVMLAALETKERYKISYWDAAIIEAARALGCDTVLTEDLNHGQDYGGVRAENPFLED